MQNSHYHEWITRNVTCPISFTDSTSIEETIECITKSAGEQIKYFNNVFQNGNMQNLPGKLGQQSAICWISLGLFRDQNLFEKEFQLIQLVV